LSKEGIMRGQGWFDELPGIPKALVVVVAWIVWVISFLFLPRRWFEWMREEVNSLLDARYFHI